MSRLRVSVRNGDLCIYIYIYIYIYISIYLSIYQSIYTFMYVFMYVSVYVSKRLSPCFYPNLSRIPLTSILSPTLSLLVALYFTISNFHPLSSIFLHSISPLPPLSLSPFLSLSPSLSLSPLSFHFLFVSDIVSPSVIQFYRVFQKPNITTTTSFTPHLPRSGCTPVVFESSIHQHLPTLFSPRFKQAPPTLSSQILQTQGPLPPTSPWGHVHNKPGFIRL